MIFHKHNKQVNVPSPTINNILIDKVDNFNLLGLTVATHLKWKNHTDLVSITCSRITGMLNKLKYIIPQRIKILLYNTLLITRLNYCLMIWGFNQERISKLQKRAIGIFTLSKYNAHTSPLFKTLNLLTINDMHSLQELKFYYKFLHNLLPVNLQNWQINNNIGVHNHNTRRQNEIYNVRINHYFAGKCLRHNLTKTINTTSNNVKEKLYTHSLRGFANYAKYVVIANYSVQCAF